MTSISIGHQTEFAVVVNFAQGNSPVIRFKPGEHVDRPLHQASFRNTTADSTDSLPSIVLKSFGS